VKEAAEVGGVAAAAVVMAAKTPQTERAPTNQREPQPSAATPAAQVSPTGTTHPRPTPRRPLQHRSSSARHLSRHVSSSRQPLRRSPLPHANQRRRPRRLRARLKRLQRAGEPTTNT
jgi:hypothetical protein